MAIDTIISEVTAQMIVEDVYQHLSNEGRLNGDPREEAINAVMALRRGNWRQHPGSVIANKIMEVVEPYLVEAA